MIKKNKQSIESVEDWGKYAGPKESYHWKEYRSAMESAKAWFENSTAQIPSEIKNIIKNHKEFKSISSWEAEPETLLSFDGYSGPSNMDLLVEAEDGKGKFIIGIEAKADEPFSEYVKDKFTEGLEAKFESPNSKRITRIEQLSETLFSKQKGDEPKIGELRYQLLTGLAGITAEANRKKVDRAIFLIHEFNTPLTTKDKRDQNQSDLNDFVHRLTSGKYKIIEAGKLYGPIKLPGKPLFEKIPEIYIGKAFREVENRLH